MKALLHELVVGPEDEVIVPASTYTDTASGGVPLEEFLSWDLGRLIDE